MNYEIVFKNMQNNDKQELMSTNDLRKNLLKINKSPPQKKNNQNKLKKNPKLKHWSKNKKNPENIMVYYLWKQMFF